MTFFGAVTGGVVAWIVGAGAVFGVDALACEVRAVRATRAGFVARTVGEADTVGRTWGAVVVVVASAGVADGVMTTRAGTSGIDDATVRAAFAPAAIMPASPIVADVARPPTKTREPAAACERFRRVIGDQSSPTS